MNYRDKQDLIKIPDIPDEYIYKLDKMIHDIKYKNERSVLKLKKIYLYMDHFSKYISTFAVCGKGCAHCCKIDIHLTKIEADFIRIEVPSKYYSEAVKKTINHSSNCPFLDKNNECSIYSIRPFQCRVFYTLDDPKYCENGEPHNVYGSHDGLYTVNIFSELNDELIKLNRNSKFYDIRDFFGSQNLISGDNK